MRPRVLSGLAALLLAASCAHAPPTQEPDLGVQVPEEWEAETIEPGAVPDDWWLSFEDPLLTSIVEEALSHNHDLMAAATRVSAAAAEARIAGADLYPQIGVGIDGGKQKQNFIGFPIPGGGEQVLSTQFSSYGVSLDIAWEADLWGRIRAGEAAALANLQAADAELYGVRLSIAGQTAKAWFAVAEALHQVELSEATVSAFSSTADRVRTRYERGLRPSLDLRLALSDLASAEADLERRRDQRQRAVRQLELLLGRYPGDKLEGDDALPPPPPEIPAGLPATLVSRRPDLTAAERRLAAADSRLVQSKRSLYPRLVLTGSGGTQTTSLSGLLDGDFSVWSLAASLLQPLFQGGKLRAGVDRARADVRFAVEQYVQEVLDAYGEVETLLTAEGILKRRENALDVATEQAVAASRLAMDRYDSGLEAIITVLDAQRRALITESLLWEVRRQRLDARVDLYLALGGGFDAGVDMLSGRSAMNAAGQGGGS